MANAKYHSGDKIGCLEIISDTGKRNPKGEIIYKCRCECGNILETRSSSINESKNCGCKSAYLNNFVEGTSLNQIKPNKPLLRNNTSGCTGVTKIKGKWVARIKFRQRYIYLGSFNTYAEAVSARRIAEEVLFYPIWEKFSDI